MTTVYARLQSRRDTAANWTAANPVLAEGEIGFITDTKAAKIGDGVTAWNDLLTRPSQEQLVAVQAAAEQAAADADQRLTATVAAQTATETARDETQTLRDQTYTYKQDVASAIVYQDLASIAEQKAITMVAGCVYDTRLDTDGGAWRDRCQGTSWFNEPLNTATRGARREFPTVAVIIVEADKATIFDGDDPSLPMWMVISGGSDRFFNTAGGGAITAVAAKNGWLVGTSTTRGYSRLNFISEEAYIGIGLSTYRVTAPIAVFRNVTVFPTYTITGAVFPIASGTAKHLAMTVLPDAPVDLVTGLQVPTIDVGTAAGTSRITHSGAVYDSAKTTAVSSLAYNERGDLIVAYSDGQVLTTASDAITADGWTGDMLNASSIPALKGTTSKVARNARGSTSGLALLYAADGMVAHVTSSWNSGIMNGDIRGAFLASTDQTDLVASGELVTNGTFDTDTTGWTAARGATLSVSAGAMVITYGGTDYPQAQQAIPTVAGKRYKLQVTQTAGVQLSAVMGTAAGGNQLGSVVGTGALTLDFVATSATSYLTLQANSTGSVSVTVDNISVQRSDADRSVKNKGLIVHGTVARTPVAAGAELVGYSGFSAANYLEQPYSSDLDFGTGDFCIMGWIKGATIMSSAPIFARQTSNTSGLLFFKDTTSQSPAGRLSIICGTQQLNATSGGIADDKWHHVAAQRIGGVMQLWQDGILVGSAGLTADASAAVEARIGAASAAGNALVTYLAGILLLRVSATPATAAQIAKIYRDERRLFQPGAACTLYGTSDAVTALAHDPVTGLLHAGTSAGRSDFDGLARVGNTTTPVAAAIAASGGMILEG